VRAGEHVGGALLLVRSATVRRRNWAIPGGRLLGNERGVPLPPGAISASVTRLAECRSVLAFQECGALRSRPLAGGKHADGVGEAERDEHDRDDAEFLLARER
jgi:hypothetical protein